MSSTLSRFAKHNDLFSALPIEIQRRLLPNFEFVYLPLGMVLYESGHIVNHVYFPTSCIVSLIHLTKSGCSSEVSVVGKEGVVGLPIFMGGGSTTGRAVVQGAGYAYRVSKKNFQVEFNRHGELLELLLRYVQALISQIAQAVVCNRHHSIDQQLCRHLLLSLDRVQSNDLVMTQEHIASMLGVRREGVTESACKLKKKGVIAYKRGVITVLDRSKLETLSCECYSLIDKEVVRLLPWLSKH